MAGFCHCFRKLKSHIMVQVDKIVTLIYGISVDGIVCGSIFSVFADDNKCYRPLD